MDVGVGRGIVERERAEESGWWVRASIVGGRGFGGILGQKLRFLLVVVKGYDSLRVVDVGSVLFDKRLRCRRCKTFELIEYEESLQ